MKLTFDEALERIGDERPVDRADIQSRALSRKIWIAEWHIPGCLSESFSVCLTKRDAIETALMMAESEDGAPYGMRTALEKYGRFDGRSPLFGDVINTVYRTTLADIL